MIRQNLLLVLTTASFVVAYSILAETSLGADSVAAVATQSYFENGKPAEAKQLAEQSRAGAEAFGSAGDTKEAQDFLQNHP